MVANTRVKTPTAAAALLIDNLRQVLERINNAQQRITLAIHQRIANQKSRLTNLQTLIPALVERKLSNAKHRVELLENRLPAATERIMTNQKHKLSQIELMLQSYDPQLLLKRGYSITLLNGRAVRDSEELKAGDKIETRVEKGTIQSVVIIEK
jgi:exodeoxyribonuclease VII large subunit